MKLTTLATFACLLVAPACGGPENELNTLFREGKYEEFLVKVREVDPRRENRELDEKMRVAIPLARISRCKREGESLLGQLTDLDIKGDYAEIKRLAGRCKDVDPKIAALEQKASDELDPVTIFKKMSPSKHLAEAQKLVQSPPDTTEARRHLASIMPSHKEYGDATRLLREISNIERADKAATAAANRRSSIVRRESLAAELETRFLKQGWDVVVSLRAADKTTLHLSYVLFSRPLIYKITNETDLLSQLGKAGFKKVIFSDRYQSQWTFDL